MKSLGKSKKKRVWCTEKPILLNGFQSGPDFIFCVGSTLLNAKENFPKRVRCPDCGQRFLSRLRECHDAGCWHLFIPPHKKEIKIGVRYEINKEQ